MKKKKVEEKEKLKKEKEKDESKKKSRKRKAGEEKVIKNNKKICVSPNKILDNILNLPKES